MEAMKSYRKELWFNIPSRRGFVNITPDVETCLRESGVKEGLVLCNAMHISASVFINDNESGLHQDFERWLEKLAPEKPHSQYAHNSGEDNADAHLKRIIMGREVVVAITNGHTRLRSVGANLLRRIRRQTPQTGTCEDYWGMTG
jgi:secondary thiamine-phosphate synthase enzyme